MARVTMFSSTWTIQVEMLVFRTIHFGTFIGFCFQFGKEYTFV